MSSSKAGISPKSWAVLYIVLGVVGAAVAVTGLTMWITSWFCAPVPTPVHVFAGFETVFPGTTTTWTGDHAICTPPVPIVRAVAVVLLVVLTVAVTAGVVWWRRRRAEHSSGLVAGREVQRRVKGGKDTARSTPYGFVGRTPVAARTEDTAMVVAPPRMGKTMRVVVGRVLDAPGAVVVTSTRPDVVRLTIQPRSEGGRVLVFDPEGVMGWPDPARWNIVAGCEDGSEATRRARAITAGTPTAGTDSSNQFFTQAATTVLRCLLHAAALAGKDMRTVLGWARNFHDDEPYVILTTDPHAEPGWEADLRKFCRSDARETVDSTDMSVRNMLEAFTDPRVLASVTPSPGDVLIDPATFHLTADTLYLLSDSGEDALAAPVRTALVRSVEHAARKAAGGTRTGRLDPVLTFVLDEVANVAPIPTLPSLMSEGGGRGITTWAFTQNRSQLRERWGADGAETILSSSAILLVLGGVKDTDFLEDLSRLCDERDLQRTSYTTSRHGDSRSTSTTKERVMSPGRIRKLPEGEGLLLYRELPAALIILPGWWDTPAKAVCEKSEAWCLTQEGLHGRASA